MIPNYQSTQHDVPFLHSKVQRVCVWGQRLMMQKKKEDDSNNKVQYILRLHTRHIFEGLDGNKTIIIKNAIFHIMCSTTGLFGIRSNMYVVWCFSLNNSSVVIFRMVTDFGFFFIIPFSF
jgi:hypothetical protein